VDSGAPHPQKIVLGVGDCVPLTDGPGPAVCHMNGATPRFFSLERIRVLVKDASELTEALERRAPARSYQPHAGRQVSMSSRPE